MTNRTFRPKSERGLTLVELLVASAILAIAAVGLAVTMASAPSALQRSREALAAESALQSALVAISAASIQTVAADFAGRGFEVPDLRSQPGDEDGAPGEILFEMGPGEGTSYYLVTIRVAWQGINGPRDIESSHYISNSRGEVGGVPAVPTAFVTREPLVFEMDGSATSID